MITGLPKTITVNGREEPIRYEYTAVLDAISALNDPDLEDNEKVYAFLYIMFVNFEQFMPDDYDPAFKAACSFLNNGEDDEDDNARNPRIIDFEQDYKLLIPAVNKVAGIEIRNHDDIHWWTFLGWFMEIGEGAYTSVLNIRQKKRKGKKLEKWEQEFYAANKKLVDLQPRMSASEKKEIEDVERRLIKMLDG